MGGISVGVDVGGTFTDLVAVVDGELVTAKVPSLPGAEARGIAAALAAAGVEVGAVGVLSHGTTVATNALLERRGARTALVTTDGFRDVIEIGRQDRASLYDLAAHKPAPLVPRELRFVVRERLGPEGVIVALDEALLGEAVAAVVAAEVEAVAVCLLFSFVHPEHERAVGEALRAALPGVRVSLSSELLPEFREYERSLDHRRERVPGAGPGRVPGGDRAAAARHAVLGRGDGCGRGSRKAGFVRPFRAGGRGGRSCFRRGRRRVRGRPELRHGRDEYRRGRGARGGSAGHCGIGGRGGADPVPDGRRAHDRSRRRLDRVARRRGRAAGRAALRGSAARPGVLRDRRRAPDRDRRQPRPRLPGRRRDPRRRGHARPGPGRTSVGGITCGRIVTQTFQPQSQRLGVERHELRHGWKGHRGRRRGRSGGRGRDVAGAPGGQRRARDRPAWARARRLRRRRAPARLRAGRGARDGARPRAARVRDAERARAGGGRPPARLRRRLLRGDGGPGRAGPARCGDAAADRRALPGPVARVDRRGRRLGGEPGRRARAPLRVRARRRARGRHAAAGRDPPAPASFLIEPGAVDRHLPAVARISTAGGSTFPSTGPARPSPARRSSSCPVRRVSSGPAGRESPTTPERSSWSERGLGNALGDERRPRRDRRGDGHGPRQERVLVEHQGAARLLGRPVRRGRTDGRPGRAHPRPPRCDARVGRRRDRPRAGAGRRSTSSTIPSPAARTCRTSRSSPRSRSTAR